MLTLEYLSISEWSGVFLGIIVFVFLRYGVFFIVHPTERAVITIFGRVRRSHARPSSDHGASCLHGRSSYDGIRYPSVSVIKPGFYFKFPWQKVHTVSVATQTVSMAWDPEDPKANKQGQMLEAVTKDQLNTGLTGQIRFRVSEDNLYPYLFGVKNPYVHILGYFISVLRERIANFEAPLKAGGEQANFEAVISTQGVSINDLRKNLRVLNEGMNQECSVVAAERYGIVFEASLITGIDPPAEVESALAAINTAHNHVSSDISLAQASADQKIVQSRQAVEIQELKVQAEVEPLLAVAKELEILHKSGSGVLDAYVANRKLDLIEAANHIITEWSNAK